MNGYGKGGNVQFALRRLMAQLAESPEILNEQTASKLQQNAERVLPKPSANEAPPTMARRLSDQVVSNSSPTARPPASAAQLVQRLRGNDLVEPGELNHLLYSSPEAHAAINAYQGGMDQAAIQGQSVDPETRERLARVLEAQSSQPPSLLTPGMAEGGSFNPIASALERVRGQSSPGSPGMSGALRDAMEALKSFMGATRGEATGDRENTIMAPAEGHADGGTTGVSTDHEQQKAGLAKRFGVRVMEQAYGLDDQGKPALGGRAWTSGQGGTPAGILDEITSVPHNLLSLMHTTRSLDPIRKHLPGNAQGQAAEDSFFDSVDPQWSKDAADRLERLRGSMNREYGVGEAHSFPEHMTDAAASLVSPVPMAAEGKEASAAGRLLEMTTPLRPRTLKNAVQDTTVMGGAGTAIDALTQRLARARQQANNGGDGAPVDPEHFSQDMGVQPEDNRDIHNNHQMVPLVGEDGTVVMGVDPGTFAAGGMVKPPTNPVKPPVLGHAQSPIGQAIQNKGNAGRYAGGMGLAPARPPRIPVQGMFKNIDQGLKQSKVQLKAIGGQIDAQPTPQQSMDPRVHQVVETALKHMQAMDYSTASAVLRSSPEAMSHPEIAAVAKALQSSSGITPATKTLNQISQAGPDSASPGQQMQQLLPPLQNPGGAPLGGGPQPQSSGDMPPVQGGSPPASAGPFQR